MFKRVSFASLSAAERIVLRDARLRSGQCIRCFQTSSNVKKPEADNKRAQYNAPKRGPGRHQRAAMVAEKIQELQPGAKDATESPHPELHGRGVDAEAVGQTSAPGSMGENSSPYRDGPTAQVGRDAIQAGGEDVVNRSYFEDAMKVDEHDQTENTDSTSSLGLAAGGNMNVTSLNNDPTSDGLPFHPVQHTSQDLLRMGENGATIAAGNFAGVVEDRLRTLSEPAADTLRHPPYLAQKMMNGQFVRFVSREEKSAVLHAALQIARRKARNISEQKGEDLEPINYEFSPLPSSVQQSTLDKLVAGKYDHDGVLAGKQKYKQPVLNEIAKMTMNNGTYLNSDGERLLRKVQSLLPTMPTPTRAQDTNDKAKKGSK